jgi:hypothetical protein
MNRFSQFSEEKVQAMTILSTAPHRTRLGKHF